jgi:hypothetical protein
MDYFFTALRESQKVYFLQFVSLVLFAHYVFADGRGMDKSGMKLEKAYLMMMK